VLVGFGQVGRKVAEVRSNCQKSEAAAILIGFMWHREEGLLERPNGFPRRFEENDALIGPRRR
jgi:hypothetical protein